MNKNLQIAVIGAGLMGHGIALTLARAGQYVAVTDPVAEARATLSARIRNSLILLGISTFWQGAFVGSFIVIAVAFDRFRNARSSD